MPRTRTALTALFSRMALTPQVSQHHCDQSTEEFPGIRITAKQYMAEPLNSLVLEEKGQLFHVISSLDFLTVCQSEGTSDRMASTS